MHLSRNRRLAKLPIKVFMTKCNRLLIEILD
jgi:hypothetical protein